MKFSIDDFFSKRNQIRSFLWIWSHLLNKYLLESFIFCAAIVIIFQGINVGGNSISDIVTGALYSLLHVCFKFERL